MICKASRIFLMCVAGSIALSSQADAQRRPAGLIERARKTSEVRQQNTRPRGPLDAILRQSEDAQQEYLREAEDLAFSEVDDRLFLPGRERDLDHYLIAVEKVQDTAVKRCTDRLDAAAVQRQRNYGYRPMPAAEQMRLAEEGRKAYAACKTQSLSVLSVLARMENVLTRWTAALPASSDSLIRINDAHLSYAFALDRSQAGSRRASTLAKALLNRRRNEIDAAIRPSLLQIAAQPGKSELIGRMFSTDSNLEQTYKAQALQLAETEQARRAYSDPEARRYAATDDGRVTAAAIRSLVGAPAFIMARKMNALKVSEKSVYLNAIAYQYTFIPQVRSANCAPKGMAVTCSYDLMVDVNLGFFGGQAASIGSKWVRRTDVFQSDASGLKSAALDKVMHPIAEVISGGGAGGSGAAPGEAGRKCRENALNEAMTGDLSTAAAMSFCP